MLHTYRDKSENDILWEEEVEDYSVLFFYFYFSFPSYCIYTYRLRYIPANAKKKINEIWSTHEVFFHGVLFAPVLVDMTWTRVRVLCVSEMVWVSPTHTLANAGSHGWDVCTQVCEIVYVRTQHATRTYTCIYVRCAKTYFFFFIPGAFNCCIYLFR